MAGWGWSPSSIGLVMQVDKSESNLSAPSPYCWKLDFGFQVVPEAASGNQFGDHVDYIATRALSTGWRSPSREWSKYMRVCQLLH